MRKNKMKKMTFILGMAVSMISIAACETSKEAEHTQETVQENMEANTKGHIQNRSDVNNNKLEFSTTDLKGNTVSSEDFKDAKLILVNFWEPWCGPCVGEMPDLQTLYEKYKEQGVVILGVFADTGDDANSVVKDKQITYPILHANDSFVAFMTDYKPTTLFTDGSGTVLSKEPLVGAHSYEEWEQIIQDYLKK